MSFGMLANIFTDLDNWIRGWDGTTFAIITIIFVALIGMFSTNLVKGMLGSKFKFKFLSFLFLALSTTILVYICIKH